MHKQSSISAELRRLRGGGQLRARDEPATRNPEGLRPDASAGVQVDIGRLQTQEGAQPVRDIVYRELTNPANAPNFEVNDLPEVVKAGRLPKVGFDEALPCGLKRFLRYSVLVRVPLALACS